jgi:hypothetical protein
MVADTRSDEYASRRAFARLDRLIAALQFEHHVTLLKDVLTVRAPRNTSHDKNRSVQSCLTPPAETF